MTVAARKVQKFTTNVEITRKPGFPTVAWKYGSGGIIRKRRKANFSFVHVTFHVDLFYNPMKNH